MTLVAGQCPNGHLTCPTHPRCPTCGEPQTEEVDLRDEVGEVVTWTRSTATPPGVREPNTIAIVEFTIPQGTVRTIGQMLDREHAVEIGDEVRPVYTDQLRDPEAGIKEPASQSWDGYRFDTV